MTTQFETIIVGGGSAALSAALMLGRARRRTLVVDGGAPRNAVAPHMHAVLGHDGRAPRELLTLGRAELERYDSVRVLDGHVEHVEHLGAAASGFAVTLEDGTRLTAAAVLVATGVRDELPDIPGLAEQWGTGVVVCPYCDGWESRDARIAVLATTPMSPNQAQLLRQWSSRTRFFANGAEVADSDASALRARGIGIETDTIARIVTAESGRLRGIELRDGRIVEVDRIFLQSRVVPNDALVRALGAGTAAQFGGDWVQVDTFGATSVPGLYAAGNVTHPAINVSAASAAGTWAGAGINAWLIDQEVGRAVAAQSTAA